MNRKKKKDEWIEGMGMKVGNYLDAQGMPSVLETSSTELF